MSIEANYVYLPLGWRTMTWEQIAWHNRHLKTWERIAWENRGVKRWGTFR